jgi:predicted Zn-dependent protease
MSPRWTVLTAAVLLVAAVPSWANDEEIEHLIPPGYMPEKASDEQGLWMEFEEFETAVNKSALLVKDPALNNYIGSVVCRVAVNYCEDFRVYLIRNPDFNASMTATGMIQVWTGLIIRAGSSDEIAAVMAHEIAHYTRLHSLEGFRALKRKMAKGAFFDAILAATTGIYGVGQASAAASYLSFNRDQETEADLLGVKLLFQAAYDPHASYRVWQTIIDEEAAAAAKREEPGIFARTHPASEDRVRYLKSWVEAKYGPPDAEYAPDDKFVKVLNQSYMFLMEDQIDTNRFGRTEQILERHLAMGVEPSLVRFFYGEMFRQRGEPGDLDMAMSAYRHSIEGGNAPPAAHKNLGYLHLKRNEAESARKYFRDYLRLDPEATDRAMIEFYLEE